MTKEQVNAVYNDVLDNCADVIVKAIENYSADYVDEYTLSDFVALHIAEKVWNKIHK